MIGEVGVDSITPHNQIAISFRRLYATGESRRDEGLMRVLETDAEITPEAPESKKSESTENGKFRSNRILRKSGRQDLNLRPLRPERSALAKLSHSPVVPVFRQ